MVPINFYINPGEEVILTACRVALTYLEMDADYCIKTVSMNAITEGSERRADKICDSLRREYFRFRYFGRINVAFTNRSISDEDGNFCFAATYSNNFETNFGSNIIISTAMLGDSMGNLQKVDILVYLILHEIGHALHAADDCRDSRPLFDSHCTEADCAMRQVVSMENLVDYSESVRLADKGYCSHCKKRAQYFNEVYTKYPEDEDGFWYTEDGVLTSGTYLQYLASGRRTPFFVKLRR